MSLLFNSSLLVLNGSVKSNMLLLLIKSLSLLLILLLYVYSLFPDFQSRGRWIDFMLLRSFGWDFKPGTCLDKT